MKPNRFAFTVILILLLSLPLSFFPSRVAFAEEVAEFYYTEEELADRPFSSNIEKNLFYYQDQVAKLLYDEDDGFFIESLESGGKLAELSFSLESVFGEGMQTSHFYYDQQH